jgi:hypothetical protein
MYITDSFFSINKPLDLFNIFVKLFLSLAFGSSRARRIDCALVI